jgi:UDP-glucose 4-epimerase
MHRMRALLPRIAWIKAQRRELELGLVLGHVLVTGGSGFFGGILKRRLLAEGFSCVSIDLIPDNDQHFRLQSFQGDLRDTELVSNVFAKNQFAAVFHCAAMLAHGEMDEKLLWSCNVEATANLAEACRHAGVPKLVFISSNCLWASNLGRLVREDEPPNPIEPYGMSKLAAEQALSKYVGDLDIVILRCPTIIDSGRLGLLAILFEFMHDGNTIWVVGKGNNRYQFIYAEDLASACLRALRFQGSDVFHLGSSHVKTLREVYEAVIRDVGSQSSVRSLPKKAALIALKLAHNFKLSPLGPYHYQMIAEDFVFDTSKARKHLHWEPTLTNEEMLVRAFQYYAGRKEEIHKRTNVSAHSKPSSMGVIRLIKWLS